jgi:hypothetical protein
MGDFAKFLVTLTQSKAYKIAETIITIVSAIYAAWRAFKGFFLQ